MKTNYCIAFILLVFSISVSRAQDTLKVSIDQLDSMFVQNSLTLLAEKYNVDAKKFLIQQERLWNNPSITAEVSAYNWNTQRAFDAGNNGEKLFTAQQLLLLAGKRDKRINIAKFEAQISEQEFYSLSRALKFQLRSSFYSLYFSQRAINALKTQYDALNETINTMEIQYTKGNIPYKDLMRLEASQFELSSMLLELKYNVEEELKTLRVLINSTNVIQPVLTEQSLKKYKLDSLNMEGLVDVGLLNRSDLKIQELTVEKSKMNYSLQRALGVPDLHVGGTYDQAGSYIQNYVGVNVGFDLPVFNRNQGNIKAARAEVERQKFYYTSKQLEVRNEIYMSIQKVRESENLYKSVDKKFSSSFEAINSGILENFKKKNISLIEFVDFFETYNAVINQLSGLNAQRINAYEELNYNTGKELF
ncbi:MAG: outer rane efflux protein [Chitinophagaceae bacterium]|nr:outer rane efflux protein [Chitinophagaceae bacterium]